MSMMDGNQGEDQTDLFDVDAASEESGSGPPQPQPLYQQYEGSKIVISKQVGKYWKNKYDAALKAYEEIFAAWEEIFRYYNHSQGKAIHTPRGVFKRGDSSENIVFSNLNIMLPAIYSRDPDVTCNTNDKNDEPLSDCLEALLNAIFRRRNLLNAKPKIKKAAGMALLSNFGVFKLDWTKKDDSVELAQQEMQRVSDQLVTAKDQRQVEELYGQLESLEASMEVLKPGGASLGNVLPHNLIIDPDAEQADGADAGWMCETVYFATAGLTARFTYKENIAESNPVRNLIYKPTHKAVFSEGSETGKRDDGLGMVLQALQGAGQVPISFEEEGRRAYLNQYFTECKLLWDIKMKRVLLFHCDDWTWPLWVWDDPLGISRFFPYFIISLSMNTGGTVGVGEAAYVLDQQDEINDINRQMARIRRAVFNYFYYNSDTITQDEAEKFIRSLRGEAVDSMHLLGVKAGEGGKVQESIQAFAIPSLQFENLFDKPKIIDAVNRITNTSDALRGVQFKTNTNVASVESYQESMRLSVGAKVDVIEDTVADLAQALAELCVQNMTTDDVASLVGDDLAQSWEQMSVQEFNQKYSIDIVAGSMEKPNSVFKKKEAIQVAQAVGQFARAAPGSVTQIMLRVLQQAFTEVAIKPEDWQNLTAEINANMQKGAPAGAAGAPPGGAQGQPGRPAGVGADAQALMDRAAKMSPAGKQRVVEMNSSGATPQDILSFINGQTGAQ
jgi:hypothetical protein